jgi:GAF domain-containing protein
MAAPSIRHVHQPGLPDSSSLGETLDRVLEHVRNLLPVDGAAFLFVDWSRRTVEPLAGWFASAELRDAVELGGKRPYEPRQPGLTEVAVGRGAPLLLPRVEAWEAAPRLKATLEAVLGEQRVAGAWEAYREASVIACPVRTAVGTSLGALIVASISRQRTLGPTDLRTVEALADLTALALERAELLEAEGRRARDELLVGRATEEMSASLELDVVYDRIVDHAARVTGATKSLLTRLDASANELRVAATKEFSRGFARRRLALDRGMLGQVARTREPYMSRSADADAWDDSVVGPEGIGSFMHAPIELGPRLFGVLTVAHEQVDRFGQADLELLSRLARSSAAAIANAIDFERERRIAHALTLGFVPESLPEVPDYEVGLLYEPSANEPTGGDLYGAWRLPGGDAAVLIGDVVGKGVERAALSAMARFFIEARGLDSTEPSAILSQANAMLHDRLPSEGFVTAFLGVLSPGRLRYCNAGHLPPLRVREGEAVALPGHGVALGVERAPGYADAELELSSGDLVFAYTDGLIEARRSGEVYGAERLTRLVAQGSGALSPEELVRFVHQEVAGWADGLSDDVVALALRRRS